MPVPWKSEKSIVLVCENTQMALLLIVLCEHMKAMPKRLTGVTVF